MILDRIDPLSLAKILGVLYAVFGLLFAVLYGGLFLAIALFEPGSAGEIGGVEIVMGGLFLLIMPIVYAGLGFVGGLLTAWLYNLTAGWLGGLELELRPRS